MDNPMPLPFQLDGISVQADTSVLGSASVQDDGVPNHLFDDILQDDHPVSCDEARSRVSVTDIGLLPVDRRYSA
jgi:hypothetical protein